MKVVVENTGIWKQSTQNDGKNRRVTFKNISGEGPKWVYLNMTDYEKNYKTQQMVQEYWEPVLILGQPLEVQIFNGNGKTVDKFAPYTKLPWNGTDTVE